MGSVDYFWAYGCSDALLALTKSAGLTLGALFLNTRYWLGDKPSLAFFTLTH